MSVVDHEGHVVIQKGVTMIAINQFLVRVAGLLLLIAATISIVKNAGNEDRQLLALIVIGISVLIAKDADK